MRTTLPYYYLLSASVFHATGTARILSTPDNVKDIIYDFIVIGGGTAGSVVASRLSENPAVRVLVIEAGVSNTAGGADTPFIQVPFLVSETANSIYDWNYTTTPQAGLNGRSITYPRGFVLGGSSSINFMAYTRGSADEYNRLAAVTGDPGWGWSNMLKYALKGEKHVASADGHNTTGQFDPQVHGTSGPLLTSLPGLPASTDLRVLNTTSELSEFPFRLDASGGNPLGISWLQSTIGNSARSSGATAYLTPTVERPNLDVLTNTYVTRLIPSKDKSPKRLAFRTVEFSQGKGQATSTLTARQEVILSAGSIGTPQILQLSGIGDKKLLKKIGVTSTFNLPDVGQNLQDHLYVTIPFTVNSTQTFDTVVFNPTLFSQGLQQYNQNKTGLFANNAIANQIAFLRLPNSSSALKSGDPSAGPTSPHYEFAFCNGYVATTQTPPTSGNYFSLAVIMLTPSSRGSLQIQSPSVFDHPLINPNYLSVERDIDIYVEAIKAGQRFLNAPAWKGYLETPFLQNASDLTSDDNIKAYIRSRAITLRHPVSTATMSKSSDKGGVVGPDLLVKGVDGLRVVDASVLPFTPAAHPQAAIYAVAERAADIIKAFYGY